MKQVFEKMKGRVNFIILIIRNWIEKLVNSFLQFVQKAFLSIKTKFNHFKEYILTDRKRTILFVLFFPFVASLGTTSYFLLRKHFKVHTSIQSGFGMVPLDAEFYIEIKKTQSLKEKLSKAKFFSEIETSEAWTKFISSLAFKKLGEVLYIVELKSNSLLNWSDFIELFADSIGYISFQDGNYSVIAKTNLKSQFGINVFESFKARNIPLKEAKDKTQEEKKKDNPTSNENSNNSPEGANSENPQEENLSEGSDTSVVSEDNYEKSYLEEGIETGNILISVVNGNNGAIYFVLVDDYFFVSNSIERLTQTLLAATKPSKYSIQGKKEMEGVMKEYYKEDILGLAYFNLTNTNFTPFLKPISENGESISLFFKTENDLLSADIYVTERKNENTEGSISIEKIQSSIPNDVLLAIYSNSIGIKEYINSLLNPGEAWPELSNMVKLFLKNGKVEEENYFPARAGSAILFHKSELKGGVNQLYPDMSLGYVSTKSDDTFLKSIFKTGKPKKETHLDIPIKNYSRESSEYSPSLYQIDKLNWISSNIENAKDCIAAAKGNKPTLSDLRSSQFESPWKESPHHIVLNWQRLKEDTRVLFIYGGLKSSLYTEKTIQNDIDPLLETFNWIESIHFSLGAKGSIYGKMKLSAL